MKSEFNPIIPALNPPPILLIDRAIPRKVAFLQSMSLELSTAAVSGSFKILYIVFSLVLVLIS